MSLTGRCYCGASTIRLGTAPVTVAYCHCTDCRRWTGAPVAAFAAVPDEAVTLTGAIKAAAAPDGVARRICGRCGSPLAAVFRYLPGHTYIPLGVLEDAAAHPPQLHSHFESRLPWLHLSDGLPHTKGSSRGHLHKAAAE